MNEYHAKCGSDEWRTLMRETILPWALSGLDLGDDVLEVGPGYGAATDVLAESLPGLTAVEIDPALVALLEERFKGNDRVTIVRGDATALDYPDGRFSGAACFTMLHHVPTVESQDRLFSEVARTLRPGGVLVAGDSLANPETAAFHEGDTYNPVDPAGLRDRWLAAGLHRVQVRTNAFGWSATGRKPGPS